MKHSQEYIINLFCFCCLCICFFLFSSCKKFVQVPQPSTQIQTSQIFENDASALSAALGVYSKMVSANLSITNGGVSVYAALSADEMNNTVANPDVDAFTKNSLLASNPVLNGNFWKPAYSTIYSANAVLEGLKQSKAIAPALKAQLQGEMLVCRSLCYFYLVHLFGDVPLQVSTDFEVNQSAERRSSQVIYDQIITDLKEAKNLLTPAYPSAGRVRANKWAATSLLARIYLYTGDWSNAEKEASDVLNSGMYSLTPAASISNAYANNSTEAVWQVMRETSNTTEGAAFIPSSATTKPAYSISASLLQAFEAGDLRKKYWMDSSKVGSPATVFYYPKKYRQRSSTSPVQEYLVVLRLAEMYLVRAEARAQQNTISGALQDINQLRSRAGLADTVATDKTTLLKIIEHERQVELFAEWGHRWMDLKRSGRLSVVMPVIKGANWQDSDALYPIPQSEINSNARLTQNPGY